MDYKKDSIRFEATYKLDGKPELEYVTKSEEDKAIDFVRWNQAMEGFEMTPESEEDCRRIFRGEITADEAIKKALKRHGFDSDK